MTDLEQKLTGENAVLRELLTAASSVLHIVLDDNDMDTHEADLLQALLMQIDTATTGRAHNVFDELL